MSNIDPDGRYFFGLFGSTSSQRRMARAERFAQEVGGSVVVNERTGKPSVNYGVQDTSDGGFTFKSTSKFGDFSYWKNFKETMHGLDKAMQGTSGNEYTGVQGMREFGDYLGKGSTYVKVTGVIITASSVLVGPEAAPIGIAIYNAGGVMDDASTTLQTIADYSQEKNAQATTRVTGFVLGKVTDRVISKNISGEVSETILQHRADAYIGQAKDILINHFDNKDKINH